MRSVRTPQEAILRQLEIGGHNLLVMGVSPRPGDELFFGEIPAELLARADCSILFVASEPATSGAESDKTSAIEEYPTPPLVLRQPRGVTV